MSSSSSTAFVSADGKLDVSCLRSLPSADPDESLSLVCALGAHGIHQSTLLDELFNTSFSSSSSSSSISYDFVRGHDSAVMAEPPRHLGIFDVEPFDGPSSVVSATTSSSSALVERDDVRDMAWSLALSLSNVILFVVRMHDLVRPQCNGMDGLRASLSQMLLLQTDGLVPILSSDSDSNTPSKRALLVVVRDYEADVATRDEVISGVLHEMQSVYSQVAKPPRAPSRISDIFEFEFALLPSKGLLPDEYHSAVSQLKGRLLDATADDYLFERGAYAIPVNINLSVDDTPPLYSMDPTIVAEKVWTRMEKDRTQDVPPKKDLMSAFDCDNAMRNVWESYQRNVRVWKRETDGGVIIEQFGMHAAKMMKDTLSAYDVEAAPHRHTKAFRRKRDELKDLLDADLYNLFVMQIGKLRDVTYRAFKDRLESFDEGDSKLDRSVKSVLNEAQKSFKANAQGLKPSGTAWRYDNDAQELAAKMREDATDKLQRARIADYQEGGGRRNRRAAAAIAASATPKRRQPISLGIHYLDPAPFGMKDSRFDKLNDEDDVQYQPNSAIFAGPNAARGGGGLSVPVAPGRNTNWNRANQDFIFTERK